MPSKSKKQRRFMAAAANNPDFAKRAGIPQSVAREYHEADKARMYEGGLAPMGKVEEGKGGLGGLGAMTQSFRKGGKALRREAEGYERRPKAVGRKGSKISYGNWGTTRKKGWRAYDPDTRSGRERQRRRKMKRRQAEGRFGEDVLMNVKNPKKRRNLVRAGWQAYTPVESRKGKPGSKRYKYGLTKDTVFYPPQEVTVGGGNVGVPRTITTRDPMSYIGAEGGEVRNMFYGGPARRRQEAEFGAETTKRKEEDPDYEDWMYYGRDPLGWKDIPGKGGIKKMLHIARMKALGWIPDRSGEGIKASDITWYPPDATPGGYTPRDPADIPGAAVPPGREGEGTLVPPVAMGPPPDPRAGRDTEYSRALRQHRARVAQTLGGAGGGAVRGYQEGGPVCNAPTRAENPYPPGSSRWKVMERRCGRDPNAPEPEAPPPAAEVEEEDENGGFMGLFRRSQRELEEQEQAMGGYIPASREVGYGVGGYIPASREVGYQMGGLAAAMPEGLRPPMGGVPPTMQRMMPPRGGVPMRPTPPQRTAEALLPGANDPNVGIMQAYANAGKPTVNRFGPPGMPPPVPGRGIRGRMMDRYAMEPPSRVRGIRPGMGPRGGMPRPVDPRYGRAPTDLPGGKRLPGGRIFVPPSAPPGGGDMPGPMGGARVPPNLRGFLQRRMMENRPRRGIPGPAGAGGAPNRVGQSDQQGGLARALQRGTGRPPMSRRQGFYR